MKTFDEDELKALHAARGQYEKSTNPKKYVRKPVPEHDWELFREYVQVNKATPRAQEIRSEVVRKFRSLLRGEVSRFAGRRSLFKSEQELEDLNQVAVIGLLDALDRYDPERGYRFSTVAKFRIYFHLDKHQDKVPAVHQRRMSAIPQHLLQRQDRIRAQHGRDATAEELGVSEEKLLKWRYPPTCQSVDVVEDEPEGFLTRLQMTESSAQPSASSEERLATEDLLEKLPDALKVLTVEECKVVMLRTNNATFVKIGKKLGKTAEEVESIYDSALLVLRGELE